MKALTLIALVALGSLPSCNKVRSLVDQLAKKPAAKSPAGSSTTEIPKAVLDLLPAAPGRIVMVDYYADWCGPCRQLSPILEKIAGENPRTVQVCKVNVDKFRELASQQKISAIPDVRIFVDGKLATKFVGALPETEIRKRINELVRQLPAAAPPEPEAAKAKPKEAPIRPMTKDWMPPGIQRR